MKELFSAFSAAVFYPLVSLVMPGLAAISGWLVLLTTKPGIRALVDRNHTETAFLLMLLSIFMGTVIDDLGTRLESVWLDRRRNVRTNGAHREEWWAYLRKPFDVEPSGRRHLRKLVARLKFELGVPVGFAITAPTLWLNQFVNFRFALLLSVIGLFLSAYLLLEAASTHEVLGILRHELLVQSDVVAVAPRKHVRTVNG
jgi:hypothetical protein